MKKLGPALMSAYAFFCVAFMLLIPLNKYEWMLEDPGARPEGLTFCGLPLDDDIDVRLLSFALLAPLLVLAIIQSIRGKKASCSLWIAVAVLAVWAWRFLIHYPLC